MVVLQSSDEKNFTVEKDILMRSALLKNMLADIEDSSDPIPLPQVDSTTLEKVIEYLEYHKDDPIPEEEEEEEDYTRPRPSDDIEPWDKDFIGKDLVLINHILVAANYMDIKDLLDLAAKTVANMMKGKTTEQLREMFNIVNDFTPEEEEEIRKENAWAEEK